MRPEEMKLSEALARLMPELDPEAQIVVDFTAGYGSGIVVKVDGKERMTGPWSVVAELVVSKM